MKSVSIYEVEGLLLNGGKATDNNGITHDFTPLVVQKIYENITNGARCVLTHSGDPVGYIHKWWLVDGQTDIGYKAIIYDPAGIVAIRDDGYSNGSPDLNLTYDDNGILVDGYLRELAFVKDPAMDNTGVQIIRAAFSRKQGDDNMVDKDTSEDTLDSNEEDHEEDESQTNTGDDGTDNAGNDSSDEEDKSDGDESGDPANPSLADVFKLLKNEQEERKKLQQKVDAMASGDKRSDAVQLESLKADMKNLGFDPDILTKGMTIKQAIVTLTNLKSNMAGKRNLFGISKVAGKHQTKDKKVDETFKGALAFLGMDEDTYLELSGKKKVE